ncbi:MAG: DNA polymerase IV, partial [Sphingomonadales bacterium]
MPKKPKKSPVLCLDCLGGRAQSGRCPSCGSRRLVQHPELDKLEMAHLDCDAFYAAVEKRDDPKLAGKPLIIGGGRRGVVATCCYIARLSGVKSAMPMFKARKLCPKAVIMPSNMAKYAAVSREIRALMREITPLVEPLSVDEAFLDLSGTRRLHRAPPATTLARLMQRIEDEIGITASVGLSYNKFLAKVASDLSKPRGFSIVGRADAMGFLEAKPISIIWGVGKSLQRRLERDGLLTIGQLRGLVEDELIKRYGVIGQRLYRLSRGQDARSVHPHQPAKSISSETTLDQDLYRYEDLERVLWRQVESVSRSLKSKKLAGRTITLKLKPSRLKTVTR